jgi:sorting nexin-29
MDFIQAELVKHAGVEYTKYLHQLIFKIWINEIISEEWNLGIICPVRKKGDVMICPNIGELAYYVPPIKFSLIFDSRDMFPMWKMSPVTTNVDSVKEDPQVTRSLTYVKCLKKCNEFGIETHHLFIDFRAAYDNIDISNLYIVMKEFQIPRKLIALAKATMSNTLCQPLRYELKIRLF